MNRRGNTCPARALARASGVASLPLALAGCYTFTPVEPESVRPGMAVRVTIEPEEVARQADVLGGLVPVVRGEVTERSTDESVALTFRPAGTSRFNSFISLPWTSVERVETKVFSPGRTLGLAAIGGAIAAVVVSVTDQSGEGGDEGTQIDEAIRIPILRFRW